MPGLGICAGKADGTFSGAGGTESQAGARPRRRFPRSDSERLGLSGQGAGTFRPGPPPRAESKTRPCGLPQQPSLRGRRPAAGWPDAEAPPLMLPPPPIPSPLLHRLRRDGKTCQLGRHRHTRRGPLTGPDHRGSRASEIFVVETETNRYALMVSTSGCFFNPRNLPSFRIVLKFNDDLSMFIRKIHSNRPEDPGVRPQAGIGNT